MYLRGAVYNLRQCKHGPGRYRNASAVGAVSRVSGRPRQVVYISALADISPLTYPNRRQAAIGGRRAGGGERQAGPKSGGIPRVPLFYNLLERTCFKKNITWTLMASSLWPVSMNSWQVLKAWLEVSQSSIAFGYGTVIGRHSKGREEGSYSECCSVVIHGRSWSWFIVEENCRTQLFERIYISYCLQLFCQRKFDWTVNYRLQKPHVQHYCTRVPHMQ